MNMWVCEFMGKLGTRPAPHRIGGYDVRKLPKSSDREQGRWWNRIIKYFEIGVILWIILMNKNFI